MPSRSKLCYVLPRYEADTDTHLAYLYDFLEYIGQTLDIFLVVEEAPARRVPLRRLTHVYVQYFRFLPLKAVENFLALFAARLKGYRTFYIHYSFLSALSASLVVRLLGGRTLYWNCGLPWLYRRNLLREFFERLTYRLITHLVTGTDSLADAYARHYRIPREKVRVMPNWIDLERIMNHESRITNYELRKKLGISPEAKIILFVHRLSPRKGARLLPEIIRELDDASVVFIIVGEGPERGEIELRITNYELQNRVRFLGGIPNREVFQYFSIADAFLMPSEEEGFPHVLLEAMAAGVPFVASAVGGVPEIAPKAMAAFLVKNRTPEAFAARLRQLLGETDESRENLGRLLKAHAERYDMQKVAEAFLRFLD